MFRECYFEYAGKSSQVYDLMLCYVSNSNNDFDSGGKFDTKTDTLPRSHEILLYGKDYSAQPLEFEVEIVNIHRNIPLSQLVEIKDWLFGQDGWKTFRCLDDRQNYLLKCIFEPGEDIVDGTQYKGLRCKLRNVSPFWYGEKQTINVNLPTTSEDATPYIGGYDGGNYIVNLDIDSAASVRLFPEIKFQTPSGAYYYYFQMHNAFDDVDNYGDNHADIRYRCRSSNGSSIEYDVNTKNLFIKLTSNDQISPLMDMSPDYDSFYLKGGLNSIAIRVYAYTNPIASQQAFAPPTYLTISYVPVYRVGAF